MNKIFSNPGDTIFLVENTFITSCIFIGAHPSDNSIFYLCKGDQPDKVFVVSSTLDLRYFTDSYELAKKEMCRQARTRYQNIKAIYKKEEEGD